MTTSNRVGIKRIYQKDNFTFTIEWSDEAKKDYRLSDLQKCCPCAGCVEEKKVCSKTTAVRAKKIESVGRYALKILFTEGCSNGIYSFDSLRWEM